MFLLSIFTGWLLSASFAPIGRWYLAPIAIALWIQVLHSGKPSIFNTFLVAFTFNAFLLHWSSTYVGNTPWLILCLGQSLLFLPLSWARNKRVFLFPPIFLLLEHVRSIFPFNGFGWGRLAFSQADAPYRGVVALGGVSLLSVVVICIGMALYFFTRNIRISATYGCVLVLIFVTTAASPSINSTGNFGSLLIQGNVPQLGLDFNTRAKAVFEMHVKETQIAVNENTDYQVIIWPENSVDVDPYLNEDVQKSLSALNKETGKAIIIGAVLNTGNKVQNASILWNNGPQSTYIKEHLTPFGEYIPLRNIARNFSPFVDDLQDFTPGKGDVLHKVDNVVLGPVICYELIDDSYMNRVSRNSQLLIVQTNNATFGTSAQSAQQLSISRIRAIENHRDLVSVSTTGISAIIDSQGNIVKSTLSNQPDHLIADSKLYSGQTLANTLGNWAFLLTLVGLGILGFIARRFTF
jgi:apolipoprotein N-acyltransferase